VTLEGLNDQFVDRIGGTLILLLSAVALLFADRLRKRLILRWPGHGASARAGGPVGYRCGALAHSAQLLTEALMLSITGAAIGVALAYGW